MASSYSLVQLTFILCGTLLVVHSKVDAVKPINGLQGTCQARSSQCKGSYVTGSCQDNEGFCVKPPHVQSTKECDAEELPIITRDSWGARTPREAIGTLRSNLGFFIIHHAYGYTCSKQVECMGRMRDVQHYHQTKYSDIGYHYLIGGDGTVFEGRGWGKRGSHSPGYNGRSIGVCLLGNFTATLPTQNAISSLQKLYTCLKRIKALSESNSVFGHRNVRPTQCPGQRFYDELKKNGLGFSWHRVNPEMWINCNSGYCKKEQ